MRSALLQTFGVNLRRQREARGLTQDALAEKLNVHRTHVGGLERGEKNISLVKLDALAAVLKVDPLDLLVEEPKPRRRRR